MRGRTTTRHSPEEEGVAPPVGAELPVVSIEVDVAELSELRGAVSGLELSVVHLGGVVGICSFRPQREGDAHFVLHCLEDASVDGWGESFWGAIDDPDLVASLA